MRKIRLVMTLAASAVLAIGLGGCADESPWGSTTNETGTIEVTLTTDYDFETARPVFRSSDDETRATADLSTHVTKLPSAADFTIKLEKKDGSLMKEWSTFKDFKTYAASNTFPAGLYTITAYYGNYETQGEECPYFEAKSTFTVLAGQPAEINLTAELKNSMVVVNYTDNFKTYMSEYSSSLRTDGVESKIPMVEGKAVFVKPVEADVTVDFTTKLTQKVANLNTGSFAPIAKTLHNITFDIEENDNGATLNITFDESTDGKENVSIDLTDDLYTTPAPEITCEGFENGAIVNTTGDAASNAVIKMSVMSQGGIKAANLGIKGPASYTQVWGTQKESGSYEIDLATATDLSSYGISAQGFTGSTEKNPVMAVLDMTSFIRNLPQGAEYIITLTVTDHNGKSNDPVSMRINSENITFKKSEDPNVENPQIAYNSKEATFTVDYNGENPREVSFKQVVDGTEEPVTIKSISSEGGAQYAAIRAFETKSYTYTVELPGNALRSKIDLKAYRNGTELTAFAIPVNVPSYSISEVDAFATFAYLKVTTPNPSDLPLVMDNIRLQLNGSEKSNFTKGTENGYGVLTIQGLSSTEQEGIPYSVKSSITGGDVWNDAKFANNTNSFTTEASAGVPNGDFENLVETIKTTINQGGLWSITKIGKGHQTTLTMQIKEPADWFSSNPTTCNLSASNVNSWYVIPSVYNTTLKWSSNQPDAKAGIIGQDKYTSTAEVYKNLTAQSGQHAMVIRNVAWDHSGANIPDDKKTGNGDFSNYYCSNEPSITHRTAGYLKLGSASAAGTSFNSRPKKLRGYFKYLDDSNESGVISVKLLNDNTVIGSGSKNLGHQDNYTSFEIPINYNQTVFAPKATKLQIEIYSSNATSITTTNHCNKEECCSRGATLYVDNLTFEY